MIHFKCAPCRLRHTSAAGAEDLAGDLCPGCGGPLERVSDLEEIVGFQAIQSSEAERDAWRWLGVDGGFRPGAVAKALGLPTRDT